MSVIKPIANPLPGERVLGLAPENAAAAATDWRRRPNLFPGRALTAPTLQGQQDWQAGRIVLRGQSFTAGVVQGLEVFFPDAHAGDYERLAIEPGQALTVSGEDVMLTQRLLLSDFTQIPAVAPAEWFGTPPSPLPAPTDTLLPRVIGGSLQQLFDAMGSSAALAGILVLQPVQAEVSDFDAGDPCDRCPCGEGNDASAFEDWRSSDGARLLFYAWPQDWLPLPLPPADEFRRNTMASLIFELESRLPPGQCLPWEEWGAPVALLSGLHVPFLDRASVVRIGGRAREPRLQLVGPDAAAVAAHSRLPALWQARIEQLAGQLAELGEAAPLDPRFAQGLATVPPCGLLPKALLDFSSWRNSFFPGVMTVDVVPVPVEQLDVAIREAASLAPVALSSPQRVRLLVPVSQASWEPRLLWQEVIDPQFQATLDDFLLARARALGARQGLRNEVAVIARAMSGKPQTVPDFNDDAVAVEIESLSPWGPPPEGGGHRSALRSGVHQHFFDSATETLVPAPGDNLYVNVCLDPDQPPRELMLQWFADGNWEHRAFWGEDLIGWGAPNTAAHVRAGELPQTGRWLQLEVSAAAVGLVGRAVSGMAFTLFDGQAAYAMAGTRNPNTFIKWFCNVLPAGARKLGDEPWDLLTQNDLWAPFEPRHGVLPAIPDSVPPGTGGHLLPAAPGMHEQAFTGANPVFQLNRGERFYAWVYLDPTNPPSQVMLQLHIGSNWLPQVFWGADLIPRTGDGSNLAPRIGALPAPGRWARLEFFFPVPPNVLEVSPHLIDGIAFTLYDGCAAFGEAGAVNDAQVTRPWFSGSLPAGAKTSGTWQMLSVRELYAPISSVHVGEVQALNDVYDDDALQVLSGSERAQLFARGLDGFVQYLRTRIDRTDDLVDYGFVKVQTDIYRVRQLLLGSTDASRLAVSPALAQIAKAETAVASQAQIATYVAQVKQENVPLKLAAQHVSTLAQQTPRALATLDVTFTPNLVSDIAPAPKVQINIGSNIGASIGGISKSAPASQFVLAGGITGVAADTSNRITGTAAQQVQVQSTFQPLYRADQFVPTDVFYASPIVGKSSVRTIAIADRLKDPASQLARDYALSTRYEAVLSLLRLLDDFTAEDGGETPGLFAGFDVYGLKGDAFLSTVPGNKVDDTVRTRKLVDIAASRSRLNEFLSSPGQDRTDEATLFSESGDLSDNSVAVMRQLEARLLAYRRALARAETGLTQLQSDYQDSLQALSAAGEHVAQARHDVGVARALMAEEQARLDAINARRAGVLANEVQFIAYLRPRETTAVDTAPRRAVDPALAEAPVPACLRDHPDVPGELEDMLRVVREAPAAWFVRVPVLIDRLDRIEPLLRVLQSAQQRAPLQVQRVLSLPPATTRVASAVGQVLTRQTAVLQARASAAAAVNLQALATATWQGVRAQAQQVVSLGDLIDGNHGKSAVAQQAADEFNRIAGVCTCLHAEFSAVLPAIRLDWAEVMSQFDAAPNLRNLGNLPRWSEIDSLDRRRMQAYADFLFAQVPPGQAPAEAVVNDVVRMCLLLASHAPVGRIIAGRLPRPVTGVQTGVRLPLVALEPDKLRVGMQAIIYRNNDVIARALIEDVGGSEVSARVLDVAGGPQDLGVDVRVHFDAADVVSAAPLRTGGVFKR